jgi:hypothetical protein
MMPVDESQTSLLFRYTSIGGIRPKPFDRRIADAIVLIYASVAGSVSRTSVRTNRS